MEWYAVLKDKERRWSEVLEMEEKEVMGIFARLFSTITKIDLKTHYLFYFRFEDKALKLEAKNIKEAAQAIIRYIQFYSDNALVKDTNIKEIFNKNEAKETDTFRA